MGRRSTERGTGSVSTGCGFTVPAPSAQEGRTDVPTSFLLAHAATSACLPHPMVTSTHAVMALVATHDALFTFCR